MPCVQAGQNEQQVNGMPVTTGGDIITAIDGQPVADSDQLIGAVTRLWNSTQYYRRAFMMYSGPERRWVVNAEHSLLLDAIRRRDIIDAEHFSCVHIRRTRIELEHHPELFPQAGR